MLRDRKRQKGFAGQHIFCCWMSRAFRACCILWAGVFLGPMARAESAVSFQNDVIAVLSKAGCNAGSCHGNQNGKAGFKLSLRGQDPEFDYNVLTRDAYARRTNPLDPDQSLVLLKPTTQLAHEGWQRFKR